MNPAALIPAEVGLNAAIAICAVAFVSGTARGFSGFGSALIFMPLASSHRRPAAGRGAAPDHRFRRRRAAAAGRVEKGRPQGDRGHGVRRADRRSHRHLFPEPARTGDDALDHFRLRLRAAVAAAVGLALPRQGPRGGLGRHRRAIRLLQRAGPDRRPADRRLLARPPAPVRRSRAPISCCSSARRISFPPSATPRPG